MGVWDSAISQVMSMPFWGRRSRRLTQIFLLSSIGLRFSAFICILEHGHSVSKVGIPFLERQDVTAALGHWNTQAVGKAPALAGAFSFRPGGEGGFDSGEKATHLSAWEPSCELLYSSRLSSHWRTVLT